MEKTVNYGGVQYVVRRRTNLSKQNELYFKRVVALHYQVMADELNADEDQVASVLVDYVYISSQTTGGVALMKRSDEIETINQKCKDWLTNGDYAELGDLLTDAVNTVNAGNPDRALAPEPLPDNADPKASSAAKPNRKRRARTG